MNHRPFPLPDHYDPEQVGQLWRVPYEQRVQEATAWARACKIRPALEDTVRVCLVAVDVQNTFCLPDFELFVGGRSGQGAVDDTRRLCAFLYRNLDVITQIVPTLDTHQAAQIFHAVFFVDEAGNSPAPMTQVTVEDIELGKWRFNNALAGSLGLDQAYVQEHLLHYTRTLAREGHYDLTVWPYHAMLGSIGHALVPAFEEALFFHTMARHAQPDFQIKGNEILTEHYSALGPEVMTGPDGALIGAQNQELVEKLLTFDAVIIAGQAKSHCVAWTIQDLLDSVLAVDATLARKIYLLEDCTSPVVVPGIVDYSEIADAAYRRFAAAGIHVVQSTEPVDRWLSTP